MSRQFKRLSPSFWDVDNCQTCEKLKAENAKLRAEIERLQAELREADKTVAENWQIDAENNRLQAHLDRYLAETREGVSDECADVLGHFSYCGGSCCGD